MEAMATQTVVARYLGEEYEFSEVPSTMVVRDFLAELVEPRVFDGSRKRSVQVYNIFWPPDRQNSEILG